MVSGEMACENALRERKAKLMLVCADASDNTKKKFSQKAYYYQVPFRLICQKEELAKVTGLVNRSAVAVTDEGFAKSIDSQIENEHIPEVAICPK